jgi:hypothetical protein
VSATIAGEAPKASTALAIRALAGELPRQCTSGARAQLAENRADIRADIQVDIRVEFDGLRRVYGFHFIRLHACRIRPLVRK